MSRAYRIRISESLQRVLWAEDHVSTQLELLEILPADEMAALLAAELIRRGFESQGESLVRSGDGVTVTIDPASGTVTVTAEAHENVQLNAEKERRSYGDSAKAVEAERERLRAEARRSLEEQAQQRTAQLQQELTGRLEAQLAGLQMELGQAVNRTTAEALKRKAAQIGTIKQITEDQETGSLSIVLEV